MKTSNNSSVTKLKMTLLSPTVYNKYHSFSLYSSPPSSHWCLTQIIFDDILCHDWLRLLGDFFCVFLVVDKLG